MNVSQVVEKPARLLQLGALSFDLNHSIVQVDGQVIALGERDAAALGHLIANRNVPSSKRDIVRAAFGSDGRDERLADVFVMRLRTALSGAGCPDIIRTMPGRGYMVFDGDGDGSGTEPGAALPPRAWSADGRCVVDPVTPIRHGAPV